MWRDALRAAVDLVLPPSCPACGGPLGSTARLCRDCARRLPAPIDRCPACGRVAPPVLPGPGCLHCTGPRAVPDALAWSGALAGARRRAISRVVVGQAYEGAARDLVLALKFRARLGAADLLAEPLAEALAGADVPGDLLVPVALSARRLRRRGFNQSLFIARAVARRLGVPVAAGALARRLDAPPQSRSTRAARRRGPRGAFVARRRHVAGRCVLLVDDVLTTGATARACALALRRAGATAVVVAAACRSDGA